jgi:hypothetical protein
MAMKNLIAILTLIIAFAFSVSAANDGALKGDKAIKTTQTCELKGTVSDFVSGEMLAGAVVEIEGTNIKAFTDFDGAFQIHNLNEGTYNLIISYISYEKSYIESIELKVDSEKDLSISLSR